MSTDAKKILIIDDEVDLVEMVKLRLEANDFEVITAYNGNEGYQIAKRQNPNLILLDITMPIMDGYQTLQILKKDENTKSIPVVMLTAKGQMEDVLMARDLGACDYVVKPFVPEVFLDKINGILKGE